MNAIELGSEAISLIETDIFQTAIKDIEADLYSEWLRATSVETREEIFRLKNSLAKVVSKLDSYILNAENYQQNQHE